MSITVEQARAIIEADEARKRAEAEEAAKAVEEAALKNRAKAALMTAASDLRDQIAHLEEKAAARRKLLADVEAQIAGC